MGRLGELDANDVLSLGAHLLEAALTGSDADVERFRSGLAAQGPVGRLFGGLMELVLELDEIAHRVDQIQEVSGIVAAIADEDLRARLQLRLAAFGILAGETPLV